MMPNEKEAMLCISFEEKGNRSMTRYFITNSPGIGEHELKEGNL
jgi:hypothetical protein